MDTHRKQFLQEHDVGQLRVRQTARRLGALAALVSTTILLGAGFSLADDSSAEKAIETTETKPISSANQFDLHIQHLVKTLSRSLVTVQVASETSPFKDEIAPQPVAGSAQPIYLRNVSALAVEEGEYLICAAALLSTRDSLWLVRNGKRYPVERAGIDYRSGLALLKTSAPDLQSATYALHAPTSGALSLFLKASGPESVEPTLAIACGASTVDGYLEFNGPAGSGTVGGAFFNMDGHLLGLALGSLSGSGSSNRVFVLPVSRIEPIVTRLKCCGDRQAGYLGVQVVNTMIRGLKPDLNQAPGNAVPANSALTHYAAEERQRAADYPQAVETNGALITVVEPDSPAKTAGLQVGDVVFQYDNLPVASAAALRDYVRGCEPDSVISLAILRGNQQQVVAVRLSRAPLEVAAPNELHSSQSTAYDSGDNGYETLLSRIRLLEKRLRELEDRR